MNEEQKLIIEIPKLGECDDMFKYLLVTALGQVVKCQNFSSLSNFIIDRIDVIASGVYHDNSDITIVMDEALKYAEKSAQKLHMEELVLKKTLKTLINKDKELSHTKDTQGNENLVSLATIMLKEEFKFLIYYSRSLVPVSSDNLKDSNFLDISRKILEDYKKLQTLEQYFFTYLEIVKNDKAHKVNSKVERTIGYLDILEDIEEEFIAEQTTKIQELSETDSKENLKYFNRWKMKKLILQSKDNDIRWKKELYNIVKKAMPTLDELSQAYTDYNERLLTSTSVDMPKISFEVDSELLIRELTTYYASMGLTEETLKTVVLLTENIVIKELEEFTLIYTKTNVINGKHIVCKGEMYELNYQTLLSFENLLYFFLDSLNNKNSCEKNDFVTNALITIDRAYQNVKSQNTHQKKFDTQIMIHDFIEEINGSFIENFLVGQEKVKK